MVVTRASSIHGLIAGMLPLFAKVKRNNYKDVTIYNHSHLETCTVLLTAVTAVTAVKTREMGNEFSLLLR